MSAAALADPLRPRPPGGTGAGVALSLTVHAALFAALAFGVAWRMPTPTPISAELWAAVPQAAAPPEPAAPPPPPPAQAPEPRPSPEVRKEAAPPPAPPRDADIALERERERQAREKVERERAEKAAQEKAQREKALKEKAEREKAERERRVREEKEAKEAQAEAERVARQREDNLRRLMAQAGQAASAAGVRGTAAADAAPSANYRGLLVRAIKPNIVFTGSLPGNPAAEVEVRAAPGGTILGAKLVKSSGNKEWDEAVLRAIDRTGALPRDVDGRVPATLVISFRPRD